MNTPKYATLAEARLVDPVAFDAAIHKAVVAAVKQVGTDVFIRAICGPSRRIGRDVRG